jgi:type IV secretory pathway VirJ component
MGLLIALAIACTLALAWLGYFAASPFVDIPPHGRPRRDVAAVFLSGDMGLKVGIAPRIVQALADRGITVIGVNALAAFRSQTTPADALAVVEQAMARATRISGAGHVMLVGQSFGADMLHVALARLPRTMRPRVPLVALIVPGATVEYRASPAELFTFLIGEADALPTARTLDWAPVLCVFGQEEANSLCPLMWQQNVHAVALPGGHPLHNDANAVVRALDDAMARAGLTAAGPGHAAASADPIRRLTDL